LGVIYKPDIISNAITWARKRSMQTIVDELYALSTHKKTDHGFKSVIRILDNKLGDDVHMVWALSKDFGASGLRVGYLYTQNDVLIEGLANMNVFSGVRYVPEKEYNGQMIKLLWEMSSHPFLSIFVSTPTAVSNPIQMVVAELLTDDEFVDSYLDISRDRLRECYHICICKLEEMVLPFIPAEAGMFVYVDFSSLLPQKTMEWEGKLSQLIMDHARMVLTPGESQRDRSPGMFRICYAWNSPQVLEIGMERLSRLVGKIRRMDWGDLNETTLSGVI
jgi:aspartate/methionine/tyrosine aminotransferase